MRDFQAGSIPQPDLPADVRARLRGTTPYDLEIGAGQGLHAIRYCQDNPRRDLIAIERTHQKFASFQRRHRSHPELKGLFPVQADAVALIAHFVANETLARVFLLYPNPSPKAKHANLRWYNRPFMGFLHQKMRPGATLHLATNLEWYAQEAKVAMTSRWKFTLAHEARLHDPAQARTHFEKKYLQRQEVCYDLIFQKPGPAPQCPS